VSQFDVQLEHSSVELFQKKPGEQSQGFPDAFVMQESQVEKSEQVEHCWSEQRLHFMSFLTHPVVHALLQSMQVLES
jgi:hypothetical protein